MRVDRVVKRYKPLFDYEKKENVYQKIVEEYSVMNISASDFSVFMEMKWSEKYVPEKIGRTEFLQKEEVSRILREKIADLVACRLCTELHHLKKYEHLALLLDYSATKEAWNQNKKDSETFIYGSKEKKTELFWNKLKPLLALKKSVLEEKTDQELVENWKEWQPLFQQFCVLDKIAEEAKEIGVDILLETAEHMKKIREEAELSIHMLNCRAGIVASVYYSKLSEKDIRKIEVPVLEKIAKTVSIPLRDYIQDNMDIMNYADAHIKKQLQEKLEQIRHQYPSEVAIGNPRGKIYDYEKAVQMLKNQRPVYVIGENGKLINMIQAAGQDGFLKTMNIKKRHLEKSDFLKKEEILIKKIIEEKKPLSEEGIKIVRLYMAKMLCREKALGEKRLGNSHTYNLFLEDEQKFIKAAKALYHDPAFERVTKNLTLDQLEDFVKNSREMELNKRYLQEMMLLKQEKEVAVNVAL